MSEQSSEQQHDQPSEQPIVRIWPSPALEAVDDDELAAWYSVEDRSTPWVRVNFVSSLDGSATRNGLSAGLSGAADHRVFDVLRRLCDVVVVGAGTVRAEDYGPMRLDAPQTAWRVAKGLRAQPAFAIVSGRLDLDPASTIFTAAPVRPLVITTDNAPDDRRQALAAVADVISCGSGMVDPILMMAALTERGLLQVHCEGGPRLFGTMITAGVVDELCLTLSPVLEAGVGPRISGGISPAAEASLTLAQVLESDGSLLLRYTR